MHIIGTDMRDDAAGRWFVDEFFQVPPGDDIEFAGAMFLIAQRTKPDVIFPQLTNEAVAWAMHRDEFDCPILIDDPWTVEICHDKSAAFYALRETRVPIPAHKLCENLMEFAAACQELGWPSKPVCFKPTTGKGMRGFHVIATPNEDRSIALLEGRPGSMRLSFSETFHLLCQREEFPPLLVMETHKATSERTGRIGYLVTRSGWRPE